MIALIFAIGWFVTACAFTWKSWKVSELENQVWALKDQLWHMKFMSGELKVTRKLYR